MIFNIYARHLNCTKCHHKYGVDRHALDCPRCGTPFPDENTKILVEVMKIWRIRIDTGFFPDKIYWTKFYPAFGAYHHIYAVPFHTIEEVLIAENLMYGYKGKDDGSEWIASYRHCDQPEHWKEMNVLSWQPLLWDEDKEVHYVGDDEGERTIPYTMYE